MGLPWEPFCEKMRSVGQKLKAASLERLHFALLLLLQKIQNKEGFIAFVRDLRFTSLSAFFHNNNASCYTLVFLKCTKSFFVFYVKRCQPIIYYNKELNFKKDYRQPSIYISPTLHYSSFWPLVYLPIRETRC